MHFVVWIFVFKIFVIAQLYILYVLCLLLVSEFWLFQFKLPGMKVIFVLKCKIITNNKRGSMKINEGIQYTVTEILYMPQWENESIRCNKQNTPNVTIKCTIKY
jgi:hypothetical protein